MFICSSNHHILSNKHLKKYPGKDGHLPIFLISSSSAHLLPRPAGFLLFTLPMKHTTVVVSSLFCLRLAMQKDWQEAEGKGHNKCRTTTTSLTSLSLLTAQQSSKSAVWTRKKTCWEQMTPRSHLLSSLPVPELCKSRGERQAWVLGQDRKSGSLTNFEALWERLLLLPCCYLSLVKFMNHPPLCSLDKCPHPKETENIISRRN